MAGPHYLDRCIGDVCDGEMFKENEIFKAYPTAIQIIAYYDLVEVVNPLGTRTGKHKLGKYTYMQHAAVSQSCCMDVYYACTCEIQV